MKRYLCSFLVLVSLCAAMFAQERPTAFINARIIPIVGQPIEEGILLVQNGKITAVGDARTVRLASNVQIVDLKGKVIMPGLVVVGMIMRICVLVNLRAVAMGMRMLVVAVVVMIGIGVVVIRIMGMAVAIVAVGMIVVRMIVAVVGVVWLRFLVRILDDGATDAVAVAAPARIAVPRAAAAGAVF